MAAAKLAAVFYAYILHPVLQASMPTYSTVELIVEGKSFMVLAPGPAPRHLA
jgi:hypothetical protein